LGVAVFQVKIHQDTASGCVQPKTNRDAREKATVTACAGGALTKNDGGPDGGVLKVMVMGVVLGYYRT
jgi:co-chaperonin GroES (HSP10)